MRADLHGQVALVSGAASPVGQAVAARLAESGARVLTDIAVAEARLQAGRLDIVVDCTPLAEAVPERPVAALAQAPEPLPTLLPAAAAAMAGQGGGRIVSVIGMGGIVPAAGEGAAASAMAGIVGLTRAAALELGAAGVLVNAVAAGPGAGGLSHVPLGRLPTPAAVANAVLFLVAPASSYVTGHVLVVDGGFSAGYTRNF